MRVVVCPEVSLSSPLVCWPTLYYLSSRPPGEDYEEDRAVLRPPKEDYEEDMTVLRPSGEDYEEDRTVFWPPIEDYEEDRTVLRPPVEDYEEDETVLRIVVIGHPYRWHYKDCVYTSEES